jgi:hypothetical protein
MVREGLEDIDTLKAREEEERRRTMVLNNPPVALECPCWV